MTPQTFIIHLSCPNVTATRKENQTGRCAKIVEPECEGRKISGKPFGYGARFDRRPRLAPGKSAQRHRSGFQTCERGQRGQREGFKSFKTSRCAYRQGKIFEIGGYRR